MRTACARTARRTGTSEDPVKPACVPRRVLGSAVVVLVAQAARHLAEHLTWPGLGEFAAVFILVLVAMAAFIPEAGGERGAAFAVAAGVLFAVLAVLWLLAAPGAWASAPRGRRSSSSASRSFCCSASPGDSPSRVAWPAEPIHPALPRRRGVWFESGVTRLATASVK